MLDNLTFSNPTGEQVLRYGTRDGLSLHHVSLGTSELSLNFA